MTLRYDLEHGKQVEYRMDRNDLEPRHRVYQGQPGLQALLRGAYVAKRLTAMGAERYRNGFSVTLHPDLVDIPRSW